jgi:hypothetical protein
MFLLTPTSLQDTSPILKKIGEAGMGLAVSAPFARGNLRLVISYRTLALASTRQGN